MPSTIESEPFSPFLICSQFVITSETVSASTSPKTCGWRRTSFSWIPRATSRDRERAGLAGEHRVEHHLVEQVAELVLEPRVGVGVDLAGRARRPGAPRSPRPSRRPPRAGSARASGGSARRPTGSRPAPAAARTARRARRTRRRPPPCPTSTKTDVRWSGSTSRSSASSGTVDDLLVGQAEPLEHGDRRVGRQRLEQHELDVGEDQLVDAVADEQRAVQARRRRPRTAARRRGGRRPSGRRRAATTRGPRTTGPGRSRA